MLKELLPRFHGEQVESVRAGHAISLAEEWLARYARFLSVTTLASRSPGSALPDPMRPSLVGSAAAVITQSNRYKSSGSLVRPIPGGGNVHVPGATRRPDHPAMNGSRDVAISQSIINNCDPGHIGESSSRSAPAV